MILDSIKKMLVKQKSLVGLDLGSRSIKLAELQATRKGYSLKSFHICETPSGAISGGDVLQPATVSEAIQSLMKEHKIKNKNLASNLSGSGVIVKKITMPQMEKNLVEEQIQWEAEQYIPFDISEISLDYHILERSKNQDNMEVLLIAAKKEFVANYLSSINPSGVNCKVLDISNFAFANCFEVNYGLQLEPVALINIGEKLTNFVVVENGEVTFCRDISIGGWNFTNDIHKELGITQHEAEAMKMSAINQQEVPEEVLETLRMTCETVCEEIQNSIDFYQATASDGQISKLFVTGGSSQVPGLMDYVSGAVGIGYEIFDPFLKVSFESKKFNEMFIDSIRPFAAIALGLALRKSGDA